MPYTNPIISGSQLCFYNDEEKKKEAQKELETFISFLEDYSSGKSVICLTLENLSFKEYALKYLLEKRGMFCVENHAVATADDIHYVLTFVDSEQKACFPFKK